MTHTYKVGDKGKTRGGDDYEVLWVGRDTIVAEVLGSERQYDHSGIATMMAAYFHDLIPPKRRIQGWVNWMRHECGIVHIDGPYDTQEKAGKGARIYKAGRPGFQRVACIYIDIEEGEGLNDDH